MNKIRRKLKRANKGMLFIYRIIIILYIVGLFFFITSLLHLTGIETFLRVFLIIFFILYLAVYAFYNLLNLLQRKYKGLLITSFISIIFVFVFFIGSYYINFIYNNINNMTEEGELLYKSYLITLKDTEFNDDLTVGIINKEIETDDYDLASKLYKEEKLSNETKDYDDYIKMLSDLYAGTIEACFVPGNYITLFRNEEGFENIATDTKVLHEYGEKKKNEDLTITSDKDFDEPLTFLLLGVDSEVSGLKDSSAFNGDTLMVITFNPKTLNTVMVSIPRDTFVPIACRNDSYAKINSAAAYGTNCVINTINNFLDIDINYYVKINFKGVVELVEALGGVEVDVEKPYFNSYMGVNYHGKMCEQNSDRLYGKHLVCIDPGLQTLNGEQALAYARNRHLYIGGDLDRVRHQQQVVEAIAGKVLQFNSLKDFQKILNAISNNLATNMDTDTILSGYQVIKKMVGNLISGEDVLNISKAYLETYSLNVYVQSQGRNTSAQGYYTDSLEDIQKALKVSLGEEKEEAIKTFSFSVNETYELSSPGKGKRTGQSGELLPSFVGKSVNEAESFCNEHGIDFDVEYVDSDSEYYNSSVSPGLIGYQSVHKDVLLSSVSKLTVYVPNAKVEVPENPNKDDDENKKDDEEENNDQKDNNNEEKNEGIDEVITDLLG